MEEARKACISAFELLPPPQEYLKPEPKIELSGQGLHMRSVIGPLFEKARPYIKSIKPTKECPWIVGGDVDKVFAIARYLGVEPW
jgi:hypothetical protein